MMREYIQRFHRPNDFEYIHPGVPGASGRDLRGDGLPGGCDEDRASFCRTGPGRERCVAADHDGQEKSSDTFERLQRKYFENRARGYPDELAEEVWRQVASFSGYSFCKAHSASYAVESFQSLYLKTYYPLEFMVG